MGFSGHGLANARAAFEEIEHALRQVVLDHGGSLSHHHGVGKIRQSFLPQVHSAAGLELIRAAKRAVDPGNVFGIGNGALSNRRRGLTGVKFFPLVWRSLLPPHGCGRCSRCCRSSSRSRCSAC